MPDCDPDCDPDSDPDSDPDCDLSWQPTPRDLLIISSLDTARLAIERGCSRVHTSEWSGVEWSGVEWSGVEWSGVEWSGVEWSGLELGLELELELALPGLDFKVQAAGYV